MWCEIKNTEYRNRLTDQLGIKKAKQFAMSTQTPKFQSWFGKGKTQTLPNKVTVPFVNPLMQVFNESGETANLLETYRFEKLDDVKKFFSSKYTPGVSIKDNIFTVEPTPDRYVNEEIFKEIDRIYPNLFTRLDNVYTANSKYNFESPREVLSKEISLTQEAESLVSGVKGVYKTILQTNLLEGLFELAIQANSSSSERKGAVSTVGERLIEIAQQLYPNAKVGDNYDDYIRNKGNDTTYYAKVIADNTVNYSLKAINILSSDKAKQIFEKGKKFNWTLDKILTELAIPKEQKIILLSLGVIDREELLTTLAASYSYTIEVNTAKTQITREIPEREPTAEERDALEYLEYSDLGIPARLETTSTNFNSNYYSNLTVPGGTNYTENEIATPAITPAIKGHAQFATDKGIGWFRSDEKSNIIKDIKKINPDASNFDPEYDSFQGEFKDNYKNSNKLEFENAKSLGNKINNDTYSYNGVIYEQIDTVIDGILYTKINEDINLGKQPKTRRILEVQSDLFQKGRDKKDLVSPKIISTSTNLELGTNFSIGEIAYENALSANGDNMEYVKYVPINGDMENLDYVLISKEEYEQAYKIAQKREELNKRPENAPENQFLQLLNKDNNWVTFFIKSIIQDSAKKGYEKVLFPTGNTASKIEGHTTSEEFKKQKEDRIKELEDSLINKEIVKETDEGETYFSINTSGLTERQRLQVKGIYPSRDAIEKKLYEYNNPIQVEINQLKQELETVEREGFAALKPIYNFYETAVGNVLKKQFKDSLIRVKDEYGNEWWEINISPLSPLDISEIFLKRTGNDNVRNKIVNAQTNAVKVTALLEKLSSRFGVSSKTVYEPNSNWRGKFSKEEGVVINLAQVTSDVPFHEFLHPFILVLQKENPTLYADLLKQLRSSEEGIQIIAKTRRLYPELYGQDQIQEALVDYLGQLSARKFNEPSSPYNRFIKWLKRLFKKLQMVNFKDLSLGTSLNDIAAMMVDDIYVADLSASVRNAKALVNYKKTSNDTEITHAAIFERIKDKIAILNATIKKRRQGDSFKEDIASLNELLASEDEVKSIDRFVQNSMGYVDSAYTLFESLRESVKDPSKLSKDDVNYNLYILGGIQQLLNVYDSLSDVYLLFKREGKKSDDETMKTLNDALDKQRMMVDDFKSFSLTYLTEWLYPYVETTNKELEAKGYKDQVLTKESFREQLKMANRDISAFGYWLGTVINSQDPVSAAVALALKDIVYNNHLEDIKVAEALKDSYKDIRNSAIFSTQKSEEEFNKQFLREVENYEVIGKDDNDRPIRGYVKRWAFHTEYLDDLYEKNRIEFFKSLGDKPNKITHPKEYRAYATAVSKFYAANTQINPNASSIIAEKKASLTKRQFRKWILENTKEIDEDFYAASGMRKSDFFGAKVYSRNEDKGTFRIFSGELIKPSAKYRNSEFDRMMSIPYYAKLYYAYQEANDKLGNLGLRHGIIPQETKGKNMFSSLKWEKGIKQNVIDLAKQPIRSIKADYESMQTIQRQDGSEVKHIPIQFTRMLEEEDLKVDLLSSVLKFSQMANNYEGMSEIEPNVLILKTILNGDPNLKISGRVVTKTNSKGAGVINAITKQLVPKLSREDMLNSRLNEFVNDIVFGDSEFEQTYNLLGREISFNKIGDKAGFFTALSNMALNFNGGIANIAIGNFNNLIEAAGQRFWNKSDWAWAQAKYWALMPETLGNLVGQTDSILEDLSSHYDVPQGEFRNEYGNKISGGLLNQTFRTSSLFFIQSGGEHNIQLTGMLSLMHATKVQTKDGKTITLYEAWTQGNPIDNPNLNWTATDDVAFRNRLHAITKNLQGVYNKFDKAMLQRRWYGKLALMFRKYMFTGFKSRYGSRYVDYELGTVNEGYWNAFMKKVWNDLKEYKAGAILRMWTKEGYDEMQVAAINKTITEFAVIIGTMILARLVPDEDDDDSWIENEAILQLTRFSSDTAQFFSPLDAIRVLRNPAASVSVLERWIQVFGQMFSPFEEYERASGYAEKGDNKLKIRLMKTVPVMKQVVSTMTPEEQTKFYTIFSGK